MGAPQPGDTAPDFELPALDAAPVRLSAMRGAWVVLHFTATWCPYCDAELAHLGELAREYSTRNVKVVVVDLQEEPSVWSDYARDRVAPGLIALEDRTGSAAARFAPPRAQPSFVDRAQVLFDSTLVIDPAGVIRLFLLPDTAHFDPTFGGVRGELDGWLASDAGSREDDALPPSAVVTLAANATSDALSVHLRVAPGYHVMSDRPTDEFAIPTRVRATWDVPTCTIGEAAYPPPVVLDCAGKPLSTFSGAADVTLPLRCEGPAPAAPILVAVRYQACTASKCLAPVTKTLEVPPPRPAR
jgi:peroxiredoxin